ncbi:MAG: hypothetical protein ABIM89_17835 [Mycobacteriales bacterium]
MTAATYEAQLIDALSEALHERLAAAHTAGAKLESLGTPAELAGRMLAAVPWAHPWDEQIGPFYDTAGLTRYLGVSKQALADRVRRRRMLAVTVDGRTLYPARQFDGPRLILGIAETLSEFRDVPIDGWVIAAWLTTPAGALGGATPLDWLTRGKDPAATRLLASKNAARWRAS